MDGNQAVPNVIILAGGLSSRMGYPKHLLQHADGRPSYVHTIETIHGSFPNLRRVYFLLHEPSQRALVREATAIPLEFVYNIGTPQSCKGSASVLSHAMEQDPSGHWLLLPCDYPLMTPAELKRLYSCHEDPITCFENARGLAEPLVSIWSPTAVARALHLGARSAEDLRGIIKGLNGTTIRPMYDHTLFNTNDREDWAAAMSLLAGPSKAEQESTFA